MPESTRTSTSRARYQQIGCATRGGEASRATEDTAIALARERRAELIFLYVVDASFAHGRTGKFPIEMLERELRDIGEIVLEQARQRAKEQGVSAKGEIRQGNVADEIQRFVEEHKKLDALVVGHVSDELREHLEPVLISLEGRKPDVMVVHAR